MKVDTIDKAEIISLIKKEGILYKSKLVLTIRPAEPGDSVWVSDWDGCMMVDNGRFEEVPLEKWIIDSDATNLHSRTVFSEQEAKEFIEKSIPTGEPNSWIEKKFVMAVLNPYEKHISEVLGVYYLEDRHYPSVLFVYCNEKGEIDIDAEAIDLCVEYFEKLYEKV